jgi:integrase
VSLPATAVPAFREHLAEHVGARADAFVFTGPTGATIRRGNLNKMLRWLPTVAGMGVLGLHFHDHRHTANTFAARTGASLRDLMARMGHDSSDAAMIYQHTTSAAERAIADAVDKADRADDDDTEDGGAGVPAKRRQWHHGSPRGLRIGLALSAWESHRPWPG